jgi:hypothetical protein
LQKKKTTLKHRKTKTEDTKSQIWRQGRLPSPETARVDHVSSLGTPLQQAPPGTTGHDLEDGAWPTHTAAQGEDPWRVLATR